MRTLSLILTFAFVSACLGGAPGAGDSSPVRTDLQSQADGAKRTYGGATGTAEADSRFAIDHTLAPNSESAALLARIDQLEQRISILESHLGASQSYPSRQVLVSPATPGFGPVYRLDPIEESKVGNDAESSKPFEKPGPKTQEVSLGLQQFNFNGQWFYIVPVDDPRLAD
ncbi:secreted protein [Rhodopirellula sallentina SM41]|uniref:Secreted protein n=1 Tax=Rhodopirellula sallentina SM41 TaxID=1263870 RepID=M5UI69_9BACT|nr:secreted protein [Rhodopirellula sallentina SM41]